MEWDDEQELDPAESRLYSALRSDLSAALSAFDRAQDWADLIHDLQRVNRVLNKHASSDFLPEKHLLAKRLAQCLTSFLPSGVHLKALETYHIVFTRISSARLAADLPIYAGGLFPLLSHCSTSLKPPLLSLYETHFLPLGPKLAPVLDGLVLAILPGLEDETSEFYSRSRALLDKVDLAVGGVNLFSRAIWRALLQSPPVRYAAAHYLRSKLSAADDATRVQLLNDMPLVAFAITAALSDTDALTQRNVLDLLVGELSLDAPFFSTQGSGQPDAAIALVGGVFGTLLRRDISLTKRVHSWLLGGKERDSGVEFCNNFSKYLILSAIDDEISSTLDTTRAIDSKTATRPCKIVLALTDRVELCDCLGHQVALRMLDFGRRAVAQAHANATEISTAVAEFLNDLGSARVFAELEHVLSAGKQTTFQDFELLSYSLSMFPTKDHIVRRRHLPALLQVAVRSLSAISANDHVLDKAVDFCSKAMSAIGSCRDLDAEGTLREDIQQIASVFASFFVAWLARSVQAAPPELRRNYSDVTVADEYAAEVQMATVHEAQQDVIRIAKNSCAFFVSLASFGIDGNDTEIIALHATAKCASSADIRISLAGAKAFADVSRNVERGANEQSENSEQVMGVIRRCWRQMHPSLRTATAQSAQAILALQKRYEDEVKIVIADGILSPILARRLRNLERFACLWRLSVEHRLLPLPSDNGLFLMLDTLTDEHWGPKMLARSWLSDAFELDVASVLDAPLRILLCYESRTVGPDHEFSAVYDAPRVLYAFQTLRSILESCPAVVGTGNDQNPALLLSPVPKKGSSRDRTGVRALAMAVPSPRTAQALATVFAVQSSVTELSDANTRNTFLSEEGQIALAHLLPVHNYVVAIALTCLGYLRGRVPDRFQQKHRERVSNTETSANSGNGTTEMSEDDEDLMWTLGGLGTKSMTEFHEGVCAAAAECLATLLTAIPVPSQMSSVLANSLAAPLLTLINTSVEAVDPVLQLHFLNVMSFLVTADGPCYLSSVMGRDWFAGPKNDRRRMLYSESRGQIQHSKRADQSGRGVQLGAVESLNAFVRWFLSGVVSACRNEHLNPDSGSQEVLGVRRRWILFIDTALRHIGIYLPVVTEGLLTILTELLQMVRLDSQVEFSPSDSEFSRVDETLVLLDGLFVVASNVLWTFEHALASNDLRDGSRVTSEQALEQSARSLPTLQSKELESSLQVDPRLSGSSMNIVQVPPVGDSVSSGERSLAERATSVTNATSAVINALNPLRMINDFVKDVLIGSGSDNTHRLLDPRRSAARLLFVALPEMVMNIAYVWGPTSDVRGRIDNEIDNTERTGPPRLSTELPRERRQAQRVSATSILEPIFELRPTDVTASIVSIVYKEQDEYGSLDSISEEDNVSKMACRMLHGIDQVTLDKVVGCIKTLFEKANKWDGNSVEAKEGRAQSALRRQSVESLKALINRAPVRDVDISKVGRGAANDFNSSIPGGSTGIDLSHSPSSNLNGLSPKHDELFHWGDYFAQYSPERVETACLNFLDNFLDTCTDGYDIQSAWALLFPLLRDAVTTCRCKATIPSILRVLSTFVSKSPSPFPDRRVRREIMVAASLAISACSSLAGGASDVSVAEHKNMYLFKKKLSIVALRSLSISLSNLVESAFLEDKPQLGSSVASSLTSAISTLKKAAARSAAIHNTSQNPRRSHVTLEESPSHVAETAVDYSACEAAASVILEVSGKDWGIKIARREVLTLLEDPNFFFGKNHEVLRQMATVVKEVVAAGGASFLLSSLGTSSSNTTPGLPSLFIGRDSETVLRSRAIRRIAFCVFVSEPDFYSPQMPFIFEQIRDALRMTDTIMVTECLFCLRALLLRTGPSSISAFRATILSEIFRILRRPKEDLNATLSVLRFLDLITLLSPPDYGYERCFFFEEKISNTAEESPLDGSSNVTDGKSGPPFTPYMTNVSKLWMAKDQTVEQVFKTPFRLDAGKTVLGGLISLGVNESFVGQYATALMVRDSMPRMKASMPDRLTLNQDFESEFLQVPMHN